MTPADVSELVDRLCVRWPTANADAWRTELSARDFDQSERTIRALDLRLMRLPWVEEFIDEYPNQGPERWRMSEEERALGKARAAALKAEMKSAASRGSI